ncbi:MAG TPA: hypothetical protein VED41_04620 [Solirubrobacteraceae bacterium]|nr:hypothetical protein [Solirubrobacteraceae bacterium]
MIVGVAALLCAAMAGSARAESSAHGSIEVAGTDVTFRVTAPPKEDWSSFFWFANAYTDPVGDHCADPESSNIAAVSGEQTGAEATFSANLAQLRDHIGAYDICLYGHGFGTGEGLLASAAYEYPSPSGSISKIVDETFKPPGNELQVTLQVAEPYAFSEVGEPRWGWWTDVSALPGEVACPANAASEGLVHVGSVVRSAYSVLPEVFSFLPASTAGKLTLCLYVKIVNAPEAGEWQVARTVYTFPTLPAATPIPSTATPSPGAEKPNYPALTRTTAPAVIKTAVAFHFKYAPTRFRAAHCTRRGSGRYRCTVSWRHGPYALAGTVEVGNFNVYTGLYTYGFRLVQINLQTHQRRTLIVRY